MNLMFADLSGDPRAVVENVDTGTDTDVNLIIYGQANGKQMSRQLSKQWLTETLIGYIQQEQMRKAA